MAVDTDSDSFIAGFTTGGMVELESERIILATVAAAIANACLPKSLPLLLDGVAILWGIRFTLASFALRKQRVALDFRITQRPNETSGVGFRAVDADSVPNSQTPQMLPVFTLPNKEAISIVHDRPPYCAV